MITLASAPFYVAGGGGARGSGVSFVLGSSDGSVSSGSFSSNSFARLTALGGGVGRNPSHAVLFWLISIPIGYLATVVFALFRARRRGVGVTPKAFVATGLGLFALLVVLAVNATRGSSRWYQPLGDFVQRGLVPLLIIAIGFFVLALTERSLSLAVFCVGFLGIVLVALLYNMENLAYDLRLGSHGPEVNNIVVGLVLLIAGVGFGLRDSAAPQAISARPA